jgi:iron(III) transport system substrate-binding protein
MNASDWDSVEANANREGSVTLYHNFFPQGAKGIVRAFHQSHPGIAVRDIRLPSSQFYERFAAEYAAGRPMADVSVNSMDDIVSGWRAKGWIAQWTPPEGSAIPAAMSIDGAIWGVQAIRQIFACNTEAVSAADAPTEWMDLFDPKWKGRIGMDQPWRSVGPLLCMKFIEKTFGVHTAERFKDQGVQFFAGSAGVVQALIRGDIPVGLLADFVLPQPLADGAPIRPVYPKSGAAYVTNVAFVTREAVHPNAARVLANWFLSKAGQEALQTFSGSPGVRADIPPPKELPPNKSLNLVDGRTLLSRDDATRLTADWRRVFKVT